MCVTKKQLVGYLDLRSMEEELDEILRAAEFVFFTSVGGKFKSRMKKWKGSERSKRENESAT